MTKILKHILPCLILLLLSGHVYGQSTSDEEASINEDTCESVPIENYNMNFRVGSIFIILGTSALGTYTPILLHRISPYNQGDIRDWLLTVGKFFGTGVILATAFVHMLPEALENFSSPCLTGGWLSYGAFAGVFCMISSFALQLLEIVSVSHVNKLRKKRQERLAIEEGLPKSQYETFNHRNSPDSKTIISVNTESITPVCSQHDHGHHHVGDDHGHAHAAFFEDDDAYKHIGTYILELGIVMHSILVGITLATTGNSEFITLLIALVFHQFFEGIALGTRLNEINFNKWYKPVAMGLLYIVMTPIGIAIGIGIRSSFNSNSHSAVLASAILDSLSAGILLYNAYVSLMSMEMSHNTAFHNSSTSKKFYSFIAMYVGAGLMSLIGLWA